MPRLEDVLAQLTMFERLRKGEVARLSRRFEVSDFEPDAPRSFDGSLEESRLIVVVDGRVRIDVESPAGPLASELEPGDRYGDVGLLSGCPPRVRVGALDRRATIATLDRRGLDGILDDVPAVALPLAVELARELRMRQDIVRQLLELHAEGLPEGELRAAVSERRRSISRRGARVVRTGARSLFQRLVVQKGAEPPFWMLAGFLVALGGARLTVFFILHFHLEAQLFALVKSARDPNPMHVHHFNYGLVLIGLSGLCALFPFGRRALRLLSLAFGCGCGLVFDEFALFWNLNPEYAQPASLVAAGAAAALLAQLTYFGPFWVAVGRRAWLSVKGAR